MFYSEDLLSRTGPLAKVWLASNIERKLTKSNVLQMDIGKDVNFILQTDTNPMALRLTGQLLLGVVRIYSRKARYLYDDCNEAIVKINMAFKPGNVDLALNQSATANAAALTLEDKITINDLFAPIPDPDMLLSTQPTLDFGVDNTIMTFDDSQLPPGTIERARRDGGMLLDDDDDDLGIDMTDGDMSIEKGRDAPPVRSAEEEFGGASKLLDDADDLNINFDDPFEQQDPVPDVSANLGDIDMPDVFDAGQLNDEGTGRARESLSPLSSINSEVERELEEHAQEDHQNQTTTFEPSAEEEEEEEEETIIVPQQAKKRKLLHPDTDTELRASYIKAMQDDRSKILKAPQYLPRDPLLLALMNMQKNGQFVSSILGEGRSLGWAPELRGILSLEVVRRSGDLKRKRDSGIADVDPEEAEEVPQIELEEEEDDLEAPPRPLDIGDESVLARDPSIHEIPAQDDLAIPETEEYTALPDNFDETAMPLIHPADSGPVSLATKHAVHMLREQFGEEAQTSASARQKNSVLFQNMVPEKTTTRADATKMFFECLVLATKDAVKIEQKSNNLGGPLRIRAKRGLWGAWAETQAGGEIATQQEAQAVSMES
ncbi:hypothetical protein EJ05DRAFT_514674 [Pseudovirgaria hyperparasitica]|uniref:Double-strand-break repair protein rad21 n=1 Tax=Pseudovirgaria hyperparasitica TaxID=470096 RepID=A0A6A6VT19_9PEZI|nr:uncharacterized protein EJ05DRAFT_514674 [Pseudovirgaria hyperparasitica]KAF2753732.1 hypothetical protein EJ05DRAFT_514674 [Pseudovirgaria hyperparasitica]